MRSMITGVLIFAIGASVSAQNGIETDSLDTWLRTGQKERALTMLQPLYEKNDEDPVINYYLGRFALLDTLYDDAIDYFDEALDTDENNVEYLYQLGNAYRYKAQFSGGLTAAFAAPKIKSNWEKVLELEPTHLNANWGMFQFYLNAPGIMGGSDDAAFELANKYTERDPAGGHAMLASYYCFTEEDMVRAEQELKKSVKADKNQESERTIRNTNATTLNQMGYFFLRKEQYDQSHKYFKWAIRLVPDQANPYDSMGDHFVAVAKFDSALYYYQSALNINPNFAPSGFNKGLMLEKLGEKDLAIAAYQELIQRLPENDYAGRARDRLDELKQ